MRLLFGGIAILCVFASGLLSGILAQSTKASTPPPCAAELDIAKQAVHVAEQCMQRWQAVTIAFGDLVGKSKGIKRASKIRTSWEQYKETICD